MQFGVDFQVSPDSSMEWQKDYLCCCICGREL